jgi:hypothetical protein
MGCVGKALFLKVGCKVKKNERRHFQWHFCLNSSVRLAHLQNTTGSSALPFVFIKFRFNQSYYKNRIILIINLENR